MRKVATFFASALVVVALSSCGSKTAENTENTDTTIVETNMENTMMADTTMMGDSTMMTDTTAH